MFLAKKKPSVGPQIVFFINGKEKANLDLCPNLSTLGTKPITHQRTTRASLRERGKKKYKRTSAASKIFLNRVVALTMIWTAGRYQRKPEKERVRAKNEKTRRKQAERKRCALLSSKAMVMPNFGFVSSELVAPSCAIVVRFYLSAPR